MSAIRKLEREVLRIKYGNKHLSKMYRILKGRTEPLENKRKPRKKSLFKRLFSFKK